MEKVDFSNFEVDLCTPQVGCSVEVGMLGVQCGESQSQSQMSRIFYCVQPHHVSY